MEENSPARLLSATTLLGDVVKLFEVAIKSVSLHVHVVPVVKGKLALTSILQQKHQKNWPYIRQQWLRNTFEWEQFSGYPGIDQRLHFFFIPTQTILKTQLPASDKIRAKLCCVMYIGFKKCLSKISKVDTHQCGLAMRVTTQERARTRVDNTEASQVLANQTTITTSTSHEVRFVDSKTIDRCAVWITQRLDAVTTR